VAAFLFLYDFPHDITREECENWGCPKSETPEPIDTNFVPCDNVCDTRMPELKRSPECGRLSKTLRTEILENLHRNCKSTVKIGLHYFAEVMIKSNVLFLRRVAVHAFDICRENSGETTKHCFAETIIHYEWVRSQHTVRCIQLQVYGDENNRAGEHLHTRDAVTALPPGQRRQNRAVAYTHNCCETKFITTCASQCNTSLLLNMKRRLDCRQLIHEFMGSETNHQILLYQH